MPEVRWLDDLVRKFLFLLGSARSGGNTEDLARKAAAQLPSAVTQQWLQLRELPLPSFADRRHLPGAVYVEPAGKERILLDATLDATDLVIASPLYWYSVSTRQAWLCRGRASKSTPRSRAVSATSCAWRACWRTGHGGGAMVARFRRAEDGSRGAGPAGDAAVIPARRTPRTGPRRRTTRNVRSPELPGDREDFSQREVFSLA
jgi:hypothetical protein